MNKAKKRLGLAVFILIFVVAWGIYLSRVSIPVLQPKGPVADKEFRLFLLILGLLCTVAIPVFMLLAYTVWRYRDDNPRRGSYVPEWEHSRWLEATWWAIPAVLIAIVSVITWNATYALNPYKPLNPNRPALTIQVVSMDWKWLFIYPKQHIASVNLVEFPRHEQVHFYLTSDAPMNSFWVPQLSGQIYTMAGMQTQLYMSADVVGNFVGRSANISGVGFASMQFSAKSVTSKEFNSWVEKVRTHSPRLSILAYTQLERPSSYVPPHYYSYPAKHLFGLIIDKYMLPAAHGRVV